jgi:hyperosmotically inducible periplasmic protein
MIKIWLRVMVLLLAGFSLGCAPIIIGGGAAGAYKVAKDERTVGRILDDSNISATIKSDLSSDPLVDVADIDVDTLEGNVILTGVVKSREQVDRAIDIAKKIEGVKSVKNNLQVGRKTVGESIDDRFLVSKIKAKLIGEPGISAMTIDVDAQKGVVSVSGIVPSKTVKEKILRIAGETAGAVRVVDNMTVKNQSPPTGN